MAAKGDGMATKIYGASDDLIEFDGDVPGEVGCYGTDDDESSGVLLMCSDGTVLKVKYCLRHSGVWGIDCLHKGALFKSIDPCDSSDADPYSDVAHFDDGLKWIYAAKEWERVS